MRESQRVDGSHPKGTVLKHYQVPFGGCFQTPGGGIYQKWDGNIEFDFPLTEVEPGVYRIEFRGVFVPEATDCTMLGAIKVFSEE